MEATSRNEITRPVNPAHHAFTHTCVWGQDWVAPRKQLIYFSLAS